MNKTETALMNEIVTKQNQELTSLRSKLSELSFKNVGLAQKLCECEEDYQTSKSELSTLRANLKDAVEALEPFATAVIRYGDTSGCNEIVPTLLGDCRRAKETLQRLKELKEGM